jgi:hypothetical protein
MRQNGLVRETSFLSAKLVLQIADLFKRPALAFNQREAALVAALPGHVIRVQMIAGLNQLQGLTERSFA